MYSKEITLNISFFRSTDNAAMYKKVVQDDGQLESLNDKGTSCILTMNGLITIIDNLCLKILSLNDLQLLEEMVTFTRGIYLVLARVIRDYCKEDVCVYHKIRGHFHPLICQARQMEIYRLLCDMDMMLRQLKKKEYFRTCNKVFVLNEFIKSLKLSLFFLEKFIVKHSHFHVVLPPPEKKQPQYYQQY